MTGSATNKVLRGKINRNIAYYTDVLKLRETNAKILSECNAVLENRGVAPATSLEELPQRIREI